MNITETVKQLLIINILFFIGSQFVPASNDILALHYFESEKFKIWQPLTSMFMHGGIMHIAFNMYALYSFGSAIEYRWGVKKFLFFYISCGLFGSLLYLGYNYYQLHSILSELVNINISKSDLYTILNTDMSSGDYYRPDLLLQNAGGIFEKYSMSNENFSILFRAAQVNQSKAVGASGAIYGLLVAFAMMYSDAELSLMFIPVPIKAKYFVPAIIILFDIVYGIILKGNTGVAHTAHLGGALCGYLMMWYWKKNQFNNNRWDR
ncbi:rhomboid family intramembrane serine protease [Flavobacterium ponti]|uniref:Rhomboid family intramembrane serine protease n=1 Tax=Flavobacterium ponti TaxID=665133 RepID=A0ABV9P215_9FLAO